MQTIVRVGVDLAKNVLQVHAVDAQGRMVTNRAIQRSEFLAWCAPLPAACLVAMEACGGAHHWCSAVAAHGLGCTHDGSSIGCTLSLAGQERKQNANYAAAICEAASRPQMRLVPVKTSEQQGILCVHQPREGSMRNAQHASNVFEKCSPSLASSCRKAPEACAPICTISWKMRAMTSQAQPALRYSVHSCIDKSSMNIFTGVSSVLQLTVKKMPRCSELPPSRAWDHSLH